MYLSNMFVRSTERAWCVRSIFVPGRPADEGLFDTSSGHACLDLRVRVTGVQVLEVIEIIKTHFHDNY